MRYYSKDKKVWDEIIVNECDKCTFLRIHYQRVKNDHVFHNACLTYLIQFYDKERERIGKPNIGYNVVHTYNCPT